MIPQVEFLNFTVSVPVADAAHNLIFNDEVVHTSPHTKVEGIVLFRLANDEIEKLYLRDHRDEGKTRAESSEVGEDGRASRIRKLAGFTPKKNAAAIVRDVRSSRSPSRSR